MVQDKKKPQPERERTDANLRTERSRADQALTESHAITEKDADQVIRRARNKADAVLLTARDKADERSAENPASSEYGIVARARAVEDMALEEERASADNALQDERAEAVRILASLLPLEREQTDRTLLIERARSDTALSNRDDFLGLASHDLRNLLAGIVLSAAVVAARAPDDETGTRILEETKRIERHVAKMRRLIEDLLDIASIDAGKLTVTPVGGDLTALLGEALEMFQPLASVKGVSLQLEPVRSPLPATFDPDRLLQVLANLISNAVKFTPQGGDIRVSAERAGDELLVNVRDTGSGIPEEMLDAVFERFWQVGKNDRRGLGLGLYISKCIVEAHGGRISVTSTLGEGSNFCFILPASSV
jgi:signal transduction histidine kinase